jgi:hypothetical protein
MTRKSQLLMNEQYNERTANREQYNTNKQAGMEAATEISISYNSKASSMFSQECVGGPKNGSLKLACRAARL